MAEVRLEHVRKVYPQGGHVAIADASFTVADGERLVSAGKDGVVRAWDVGPMKVGH